MEVLNGLFCFRLYNFGLYCAWLQMVEGESEMLYAVLKVIGILIAVFLFSVFTISTGVEIGLRAYFEHYKNSKKEEQQ